MVVEFDRLVTRYDFSSEVTGAADHNPILFRFVLPKPYSGIPSATEESQMSGENLTDPYIRRNLDILAALSVKKSGGKTRQGV